MSHSLARSLVVVLVWAAGLVPVSAQDAASAPKPPPSAPEQASPAAAPEQASPAAAPSPAAPSPTAAPSPSNAQATVYLRNGGLVRGELMEVQPNVKIQLRVADGTLRDISWAEITNIVDATPPPVARPALPPGAYVPPPGSPSRAALPPVAGSPNDEEIFQLQRERAGISDSGPALMMVIGGGAFLLFTPIGVLMLALQSECQNDYASDSYYTSSDCHDVATTGTVLTLLGLGGGVLGVWGFIKAVSNGNRKEEIDRKIIELQSAKLSVDVVPRGTGSSLALTLRF